MADINEELHAVVKTGKVVLGSKNVVHTLLLGGPKAVVLCNSCDRETKECLLYYCQLANVPSRIIKATSVQLGEICAKPFPISCLAILNEGDSKILELVKNE